MTSRLSPSATVLLLLATAAGTSLAGEPAREKAGDRADREALEKRFAEKLSGATLVGTFSIVGRNEGNPPRPERYELERVEKLEGRENYWVFLARVQYGENDIKLPLTLKVLWAGDTPVITLTDFTIPRLGTFTARVMFYGDRYAGTWQHGEVGGHMWGRIVEDGADEGEEK